MISAADALRLPTAHLTDEERAAADRMEAAIEAHVRLAMNRDGCQFRTTEMQGPVLAEVTHRLRAAGWEPKWNAEMEPSPFAERGQRHVGWTLVLVPSDDAYRAAGAVALVAN